MRSSIVALTCTHCLRYFDDADEVVTCRKCSAPYCSAECRSEDLTERARLWTKEDNEAHKNGAISHRAVCAEVSRVGLEQHYANTEAREEALVAKREHAAEAQDATCYICLDGGESEPLVRNCGCRGTSGHAHLSCLAEMARNATDPDKHSAMWFFCPNCDQTYRGFLALALAWEGWRTYASEPDDEWRRLWAMETLVRPLLDHEADLGNMKMALVFIEAHLSTLRDHYPEEEVLILQGRSLLSEVYHKLWRKEDALSNCQDVYARYIELYGPAHEATLLTAQKLSVYLRTCGLFAQSRALLLDVHPVADRELGTDGAVTEMLRWSLAHALFRDGVSQPPGEPPREDMLEAAALMRVSLEGAQRMYGVNDPSTLDIGAFLSKIEQALEAPESDDDAPPAAKRARTLRVRDVEGHNDDRVLHDFTSRAQMRQSEGIVQQVADQQVLVDKALAEGVHILDMIPHLTGKELIDGVLVDVVFPSSKYPTARAGRGYRRTARGPLG